MGTTLLKSLAKLDSSVGLASNEEPKLARAAGSVTAAAAADRLACLSLRSGRGSESESKLTEMRSAAESGLSQ